MGMLGDGNRLGWKLNNMNPPALLQQSLLPLLKLTLLPQVRCGAWRKEKAEMRALACSVISTTFFPNRGRMSQAPTQPFPYISCLISSSHPKLDKDSWWLCQLVLVKIMHWAKYLFLYLQIISVFLAFFSLIFDTEMILEFKNLWFSLSTVKIYLYYYGQVEDSLWANLPLL